MKFLKSLFSYNNTSKDSRPETIKLGVAVSDPEGRLRKLGPQGEDMPPENTDYWTEQDFERFTGEGSYGNVLDVMPKIRRNFPELNLTDEELKKLIIIVTQRNKKIFLNMADDILKSSKT